MPDAGPGNDFPVYEFTLGELDAEKAHVETVGERSENLKRFFGDFLLLVGRESREGAEIVKTIG